VGFEKAEAVESESPVEEAEKGEAVVELEAELGANGNAGGVEAENGEVDDDVPNRDKPVLADEAVVPNRVEPKPEVAAADGVVPNRDEPEVGAAEDDVVPNRDEPEVGATEDGVVPNKGELEFGAATDDVIPNRGEPEVGAAEDGVVPNRLRSEG